jgi:hypothetical protein
MIQFRQIICHNFKLIFISVFAEPVHNQYLIIMSSAVPCKKVKLSLCLVNWTLRHEGVWFIDPHFLDFSASWRWVVSFTPRPLYPGERAPATRWIGGWVDSRATMDNVKKRKLLTLPGIKIRPLGRPDRSQSIYQLRYPGSCCTIHICWTHLCKSNF